MDAYRPFTLMGWFLIILGIIFVALPYIIKIAPGIEKLPWWVLWVYKSDGFYFATSPILIFISILSFLWGYLRR
jgi:hypothetical protein